MNTKGVAGGADFWLVPGQSVAIGDGGNVLALRRLYENRSAHVVFAGRVHSMEPGEFIEFTAGDKKYKVFYRQGTEATKGRAGFDIVETETREGTNSKAD